MVNHIRLAPITLTRNVAITQHLFGPRRCHPISCGVVPATIFDLPGVNAINLARRRTQRTKRRIIVCRDHFQPVGLALARYRRHALVGLIISNGSSGILNYRVINPSTKRVIRNLTVTLGTNTAGHSFSRAVNIRPATTRRFIAVHAPITNWSSFTTSNTITAATTEHVLSLSSELT